MGLIEYLGRIIGMEDYVRRHVGKWQVKRVASRRFKRPLTADEASWYEAKIDEVFDLISSS